MAKGLLGYLEEKRTALLARRARIAAGELGLSKMSASASAEGRSGIRRIRIRDFQMVSDSGKDYAGYDLGPSSPEILLGSLASCLVHTFQIHAADQQVPLLSISAETGGQLDNRAGREGFEEVPVWPHSITWTVRLQTPASAAQIETLKSSVARACPILNLLSRATDVTGEVVIEAP